MKMLEFVRDQFHPLHRLRRSRWFQAISRRFDPLIGRQLSYLPRPIYVRLVSNASLVANASTQEIPILQTFTEILKALPDKDLAFWDVGANIGIYGWKCAACRPFCGIVSFEPDPKNIAALRKTSNAWKLRYHKIVEVAVAEANGRAAFYVDDISGATGSIEPDLPKFNTIHYGVTPKTIDVPTVSLDSFLSGNSPPTIIKIDVEGAEIRVLRGAASLIAKFGPILLLETFENRTEIFEFLRSRGYQIFDSDRRTLPTDATFNILSLVPERFPDAMTALARLGYPV
jgi:FkbM family methyltransferase